MGNAWHLLRSTWAVRMARGVNELGRPLTLWELMGRGGWTSPQTVMRYISLAGLSGR